MAGSATSLALGNASWIASSKNSAEAQAKVKAKYPHAQLDVILQLGADAQYAAK